MVHVKLLTKIVRYTVEAGYRVEYWGFTQFFHTTLIKSAVDAYLRWIRYKGVWIITRCAILQSKGYQLTHWALCLVILVVYGVVARAIALICLFMSNRSRQKWLVRPSNEFSPFLMLHSSHNFSKIVANNFLATNRNRLLHGSIYEYT